MSGIARTTIQPVLPIVETASQDAPAMLGPLYRNSASLQRYLDSQQQAVSRLYDTLARSVNDRHMVGIAAEKPTAAEAGRQYFVNDATPKRLEIDDGSSWQTLPVWSSPLATTLGGTGLTSYTTGDLLYASATNVLSKLADVAAGSYLRAGGVSTAPVWSTITIPNAATTGDLWYASATNIISALAKGTNGYFLQQGASIPAWFNLFGTANTWTSAQTLYSSGIKVNNPANTFAYTVVASAITASRNLTLPLTTQDETLAVKPAIVSTVPLSPTGTTAGGGVMMGLAIPFTPKVTGRAFIAVSGYAHNTTAGATWWVQVRYGTGTAPTNGAALTGSISGALQIGTSSAGSEDSPFCSVGLPSALTVGTAYWIDVGLYAIGGGTATIWQPSIVVFEL